MSFTTFKIVYIAWLYANAINAANSVSVSIKHRIINGDDASIENYPFAVNLQSYNYITLSSKLCSGSLISDKCVLTAAHCIEDVTHIKVCGGNEKFGQGVCVQSFGYQIPWLYKATYGAVDIGIVALKNPLKGENIRPVELNFSEVSHDTLVQLAGWGDIKLDSNIPNKWPRILKTGSMKVHKYRNLWEGLYTLNSYNICLRHNEKQQLALPGDSGAPVLLENGQQIGVLYSVNVRQTSEGYNATNSAVALSNISVKNFVQDFMYRYC